MWKRIVLYSVLGAALIAAAVIRFWDPLTRINPWSEQNRFIRSARHDLLDCALLILQTSPDEPRPNPYYVSPKSEAAKALYDRYFIQGRMDRVEKTRVTVQGNDSSVFELFPFVEPVLYAKRGEFDKAVAAAKNMTNTPHSKELMLVVVAEELSHAGRKDQALEILRSVAGFFKEPKSGYTLQTYARALYNAGDASAAAEAMKASVAAWEKEIETRAKERPAYRPWAFLSIANAFLDIHDNGSAKEWLSRGLDAVAGLQTPGDRWSFATHIALPAAARLGDEMLADKAVSIITEAAKAGEHTELADAFIACFSVTCLAGTSRREQAIEQARAITPPYMAAVALFSISGVLELREEKAAAEALYAEAAKLADTVNIDELNADPKGKDMVETFFGLWVQNREYGKALRLLDMLRPSEQVTNLVYLYDALARNGDNLSSDDRKILSQIVDRCLAAKP